MLLNAFITFRKVREQAAIQERVEQTHSVLMAMVKSESLLKDAETGQRGYLYTNNPAYLEPYNTASAQISQEIEKLADLIPLDSPHQGRIAELRKLAGQKMDELAYTISLQQQGKTDEARRIVLAESGKQTMDRIRTLVHSMEREEIEERRQQIAESRVNGSRVLLILVLTTAVACAGLVVLALYIVRLMAEREKHAAELRTSEQWFRATLSGIGDGVIATDFAGNVEYLNEVAETLTGFSLAQAKGQPIQKVFRIYNERTHAVVDNPVSKVLSEGRIIGLANHTVLLTRGGEYLAIEDSAAPIRDPYGEVVGVVLVFRDATQSRKAEELLRRSEKLATAARLAATIAHEINNPLEALGNLLFLAKTAENLPESSRQFLDSAEQQLARVSHVTRQTLGFYRESRKVEQVQLSALVDSMVSLHQNKAKSKLITLECDYKKSPDVWVVRQAMEQVVANLLSNALDAVEMNGTVRVAIEETEGGAKLTVSDDGPGIASEDMPHIFEPFFTTKKDVGTGLGLWLSRQIVEEHGGRITFSSASGAEKGAAFSVFIPSENHDSAAAIVS